MSEYFADTVLVHSRVKVLVVEDDTTVRNFCRHLLRLHYDVATAANGRDAVDMLQRDNYDLVLTDLQMPEMGGIELLRHVRERYPAIDVIILTAFATVDTARQALKLGAFDYLSKPVDASDLERAVRRCLELRRIRHEKERLSELLVMHRFSQAIATSLDTEAQICQMTDFLWQRFAPESLAISLFYTEKSHLTLQIYKTRMGGPVRVGQIDLAADCDIDQLATAHLQLVGIVADEPPGLFAGTALRTHDRPIGYVHMTRGSDQPEFEPNERTLLSVFASQIAASLDNARLYRQLKEQHLQTIEALAEAIDARDTYTMGHSRQVTRYAVRLGERMGMTAEKLELLRYASLLHDIGKIGIRDYVLLKPGPLSDEEFAVMKKHPRIGAKIISKVQALRATLPIIEGHHEQVDGKGYPAGKSGDELSLETRILAIADAFEAMTADRAYRLAMENEKALQVLVRGRGTKWDEQLVDAFVAMIREEGSSLRIRTQLKQVRVPLIKPREEQQAMVSADARD
jgi:putative nucleotidyltransferase with HDIG domain